jgi:hypothetical protein
MSNRSNTSKPFSLLCLTVAGMGSHDNPVAVLDMKTDQVRQRDKVDIEDCIAVDIPRFKRNVSIYIPRSNETKGELIAEVNLWSMGVRYNLHRMLDNGPQLYVLNA